MGHPSTGIAWVVAISASLFVSTGSFLRGDQEKYTQFDRERATMMLHAIEGDLKKSYYDSNFRGLNVSARFQEAEQKIKAAKSTNEAFSDIAGALLALDDSHTFFIPPPRPYTHDFGWRMQAIGDTSVFVTAVRPGTDAEAKGLSPGDQVFGVNNYAATRENLWTLLYLYNVLRPQPRLHLAFRDSAGSERELVLEAQEQMGRRYTDFMTATTSFADLDKERDDEARLRRPRYVEYGKDAILCKLHDFHFNPDRTSEILGRMRSFRGVVLDLRGNPGGYAETLEKFLGGFFDHDVKIADRHGRKDLKPAIAKSHGGKIVTAKLVVLVDGGSGSASELFAKTIQLENRGTILGDRSSGSVMEARSFNYTAGTNPVTLYGASITEADMIMADGKSLEKVGVTPDERILPTSADMAAGRDPVLARAAELLGVKLSPEEAGKLFPIEWPKI